MNSWFVVVRVKDFKNGEEYHLGKYIECEWKDRAKHVEQFRDEAGFYKPVNHTTRSVDVVDVFCNFKVLSSDELLEMQGMSQKMTLEAPASLQGQ